MLDRKINIGITIIIEEKDNGIFSNGIRQNIISLRNLLSTCNNVKNSYMINIANFCFLTGNSGFRFLFTEISKINNYPSNNKNND